MSKSYDDFKKLTEVDNDIEASLIINLLKNNNINSFSKADSGLSIATAYTGYNMPGISIYVNDEDYEVAYDIISEIKSSKKTSIEKKNYSGTKKWYVQIILLALLTLLIIKLIIN